jgi:hypothetical protein
LIINRREIDVDLFRILENIEGNGKAWLPWMSDVSGEDEADLRSGLLHKLLISLESAVERALVSSKYFDFCAVDRMRNEAQAPL